MVKKMDAGDLVLSHKVSISLSETTGLLYTRLKYQAALSLNDFIQNILNDKVTFTTQDESLVSFAPTLTKELGHLKFETQTVKEILNLVRALDPWPGTFCFLNGKRLKVLEAEKYHGKIPPGKALNDLGSLAVGCLDGAIRLAMVQLEGKKPCSDRELLNGIKSEIHLT
jgi:methionyl-tRNA formyltransferase